MTDTTPFPTPRTDAARGGIRQGIFGENQFVLDSQGPYVPVELVAELEQQIQKEKQRHDELRDGIASNIRCGACAEGVFCGSVSWAAHAPDCIYTLLEQVLDAEDAWRDIPCSSADYGRLRAEASAKRQAARAALGKLTIEYEAPSTSASIKDISDKHDAAILSNAAGHIALQRRAYDDGVRRSRDVPHQGSFHPLPQWEAWSAEEAEQHIC